MFLTHIVVFFPDHVVYRDLFQTVKVKELNHTYFTAASLNLTDVWNHRNRLHCSIQSENEHRLHVGYWNCSDLVKDMTRSGCPWVGLPGEFPLQHVHTKVHVFHVSDLAITLEKILEHLSVISFFCLFLSWQQHMSLSTCTVTQRVTEFHFWQGYGDYVLHQLCSNISLN